MSQKPFLDGNGVSCVWVRKKASRTETGMPGDPQPVREDSLHYAIAGGYEECDPPGSKSQDNTIAPEPVGQAEPESTPEAVGETIAPETAWPQTVDPEPGVPERRPRKSRKARVTSG